MEEKELLIKELLDELGLSSNYKGYGCISYGLLRLLEREELLKRMTKGLYSEIAEHYHTNVANVERNMRTALQVIWDKNKEREFLKGFFCCPSNGIFMDLLLYELERRIKRRRKLSK